MILTAALIALSICAVPGAMAKSSSPSHVLRFKVVKRITHYYVVKGHAHRFGIRRGAHKVTVHGFGHFKLVKRTHHYVLLRALAGKAASRVTISTPNSGAFVKSTPTTIAWTTSSAVSSGYFQVSLKSTVDGASTALTAVSIPANRKTTNYSVPWDVAQAVGTYKIWVTYYNSGGWSQMSDSSDGAVNISLAPVPVPTPTPTPTVTPTPAGGTFNVISYGAVHDNSTDDAAHIQSAINACSTAGGGVVYLPAGTYRVNAAHASGSPLINQNMNIPSNVTIRGAGIGVTTLNGTGIASASVFAASQQTNIAVENLSITVTKANHSSDGDGIKLQGVSNSHFTSVYIENAYIASNCIGSQNITYTNCEAYNTIQGFAAVNNNEAGGILEGNTRVTYQSCYAHNCGQCGFYAHSPSDQGGSNTTRVQYTIFRNCVSNNNAWDGFYGWWTNYVTFDGCTATGNNKGIDMHQYEDYLITGCTVSGNGESQITTLDSSTSR